MLASPLGEQEAVMKHLLFGLAILAAAAVFGSRAESNRRRSKDRSQSTNAEALIGAG